MFLGKVALSQNHISWQVLITLSLYLNHSSNPPHVPYMFNYFHLTRRLANFSCKGPDSKSFRLYGPHSLCHNYSTPQWQHKNSHRQHINWYGPVPIQRYLWTHLNFIEYSGIMKYYPSFNFLQPFKNVKKKNVKASLSSQAEQKQVGS